MTKEELIEEIENYGSGVRDNGIESYSDNRYGIKNCVELGEYAFPYFEFQEDYDFLIEDITESAKAECGYEGEFQFCERSSKSGTEVYIDAPDTCYDDVYDEIYGAHGYEFEYSTTEDFTHAELTQILREVKEICNNFNDEIEVYNETLKKVTELVDSIALGKRSGCFSNGEVIFEPTEAYEGATQVFTPYYNPNEEVV